MSTSPKPQLNLNAGFGALVVTSPNINVELTDDGRVVVHKGTIKQPDISAQTAFAQALKTGDVIQDGPDKGWIYCEGEEIVPFLVAPADSGVMTWRKAVSLAASHLVALPALWQLQAMYEERNTGALNATFNATNINEACWYWSSTHLDYGDVWCKCFNDGYTRLCDRASSKAVVRFVRPYTPA